MSEVISVLGIAFNAGCFLLVFNAGRTVERIKSAVDNVDQRLSFLYNELGIKEQSKVKT